MFEAAPGSCACRVEGPIICRTYQSDKHAAARYILWEAEEKGLLLPYACRMGCCTACAVKIKSGRMYQPQVSGSERLASVPEAALLGLLSAEGASMRFHLMWLPLIHRACVCSRSASQRS